MKKTRSRPGDPHGYGRELAEFVREALPANITVDDIKAPANAWDDLVVTLFADGGQMTECAIPPPDEHNLDGAWEGWWYAGSDFSVFHEGASLRRIERWAREDLPGALRSG